MTRILYYLYFLLFLLTLFTSCRKNTEEPPPTQSFDYLVEATLLEDFTKEELNQYLADTQGIDPFFIQLLIQQGIKVYKIVYKTMYIDGSTIQASGALVIPENMSSDLSLMSVQHGTITDQSDAPSQFDSSSESGLLGALMASNFGAVISIPDYIGYQESAEYPHLYEHRASLASASRDMLRAVKEYCQNNAISLNGKLFLAGYSEGGYATMALHQLLEEAHADEFTVTASAPGAGAYNKTRFAQHIFDTDGELSFLNNYLWVLETYDTVYGLNRPWSYYLQEPYATQVASEGVWAEVGSNPQQLFTASFREEFANATDTAFIQALADNDIYDWKPQGALKLFHGTADSFVPFFNSQDALDAMQAQGATQVMLEAIEGQDHSGAIATYILGVNTFFQGF